jgi:hypothetical protein
VTVQKRQSAQNVSSVIDIFPDEMPRERRKINKGGPGKDERTEEFRSSSGREKAAKTISERI